MLTSVDSKGVVRVAIDEYQQWVPILDLSTNSGESYWVFGLTDKVVNCVPLRVNNLRITSNQISNHKFIVWRS